MLIKYEFFAKKIAFFAVKIGKNVMKNFTFFFFWSNYVKTENFSPKFEKIIV